MYRPASFPLLQSVFPGLCTCPPETMVAEIAKQSWLPYDLVVVKRDAGMTVVSYLLEHTESFPGVEVQQSYLRCLPIGRPCGARPRLPGQIDAQELKSPRFRGYLPDDEVGQSG